MSKTATASQVPPRIEQLKVQNFRALKDIELTLTDPKRKDDVIPLTVLLGPNGSGKSTVFDVFAFLSECFESGLRRPWEKRGRARELKSRSGKGPVMIEIAYREQPGQPLIRYHLEVDEENNRPIVVQEWLQWRRGSHGKPFRFMEYVNGEGQVISGELPEKEDKRIEVALSSPESLAVNTLGQLAQHPRIVALRNFIMDWHVSYLSAEDARGQPEAGPQERLSKSGDNLANVIQYLSEEHSSQLELIFEKLRQRVPKIEKVAAETMPDGRLLLQIKDAPFLHPIMARYASDGTLKMLAYLSLLYDKNPPKFIGIEEPENFLHPRLLYGLAEECRAATELTQILVTTHSPFFIDALRPQEVQVLWRDESGYTQCHPLSNNDKVKDFIEEGALLGDLWMEGYFGVGDPLTQEGMPEKV
ncbi:AAA family ATPase [Candidatus Poriferisocius sp.]|uniref:AAA family ATPase n=1 Tax=Candidatus Poriferisocius sp. TaxID=3101276 RepID=UPI003B0175A4